MNVVSVLLTLLCEIVYFCVGFPSSLSFPFLTLSYHWFIPLYRLFTEREAFIYNSCSDEQ